MTANNCEVTFSFANINTDLPVKGLNHITNADSSLFAAQIAGRVLGYRNLSVTLGKAGLRYLELGGYATVYRAPWSDDTVGEQEVEEKGMPPVHDAAAKAEAVKIRELVYPEPFSDRLKSALKRRQGIKLATYWPQGSRSVQFYEECGVRQLLVGPHGNFYQHPLELTAWIQSAPGRRGVLAGNDKLFGRGRDSGYVQLCNMYWGIPAHEFYEGHLPRLLADAPAAQLKVQTARREIDRGITDGAVGMMLRRCMETHSELDVIVEGNIPQMLVQDRMKVSEVVSLFRAVPRFIEQVRHS